MMLGEYSKHSMNCSEVVINAGIDNSVHVFRCHNSTSKLGAVSSIGCVPVHEELARAGGASVANGSFGKVASPS